MSISQYKLDVIRQIKQELKQDGKEFILPGYCLKGYEEDSILRFSSYHSALEFIIASVLAE